MVVVNKGRGMVEGVVMVVVLVVFISSTTSTTPPTSSLPPPPPPLHPSTTAEVMTEAPFLRPANLKMRRKDCALYNVFGNLKEIKRDGELWYNDGHHCEKCKCIDGQKRCLYNYCGGDAEVVTNSPPSGVPPFDDEDHEWGDGEEGSGRPPPSPSPPPLSNPDQDESIKEYGKTGPEELRVRADENDTRLLPFCIQFCRKICPWGYEIDPLKKCRQCSCRRRCHSLDKCQLLCYEGLARDSYGCPVCQCRSFTLMPKAPCKEESVRGCKDGSRSRDVGEQWSRGPCESCRCLAHGYTQCTLTHCPVPPPCPASPRPQPPTTECCPPCREVAEDENAEEFAVHEIKDGRAELSVQSTWDRQMTYSSHTPQHEAASDGAVRSVVQTDVVPWWQMVLIVVPLAVVCVVGAVCALRYWRRAHHDKYDINAYRPPHPLTEKLNPVTTADNVGRRNV